jgi:uncharacterized protein (DUF779 family)
MPRIVASAKAALNLDEIIDAAGPQVILLGASGARVSVATVRPRAGFVPGDQHTLIGQVQGCRVYADTRSMAQSEVETIVLDLCWQAGPPGEQLAFITRPESRAEWQQHVFADHARKSD